MAAATDAVRDIERDAYRSRWRDGTLDLCAGLGVLFTGAAWQVELFWLPGIAFPVLMGLWFLMRKRVVEPRIGRVTFGRERRERELGSSRAAAWVGAGLLLLFVTLYFLQTRGGLRLDAWIQEWISALPVVLLAVMALMVAAMAGLGRFVWYAAILVATGAFGVMVGMEPAPQILVAGALITLVAVVLVGRFVTSHPVPSADGFEA